MVYLFTVYYPFALALVFVASFFLVEIPAKGAFFLRALVALVIATFLAHVNRIFHIYPAHLYFPSGHTTFCLGVSVSLGMLRPWTLAVTLPLVVLLGVSMVALQLHTVWDILGAIPLVLVVYGIVQKSWRVSPASPPLDRTPVSP